MSYRKNIIIYWFLWFLIVISAPITVINNSSREVVFSNPIVLTNFFQRILGLLAFNLFFIQIILGSQINRWVRFIGAKAYRIHIIQGILAYGIMFMHPLFENIIVYQISENIIDSLLIVIPSVATQRGILLIFGRVAFLLASISVAASYFRTKIFFRRNWRLFHIFNYPVFYLIFLHMRLGTDTKSAPFVWISWFALISVTLTLVNRVLNLSNLKLHFQEVIKKVT